MAIPGPSIYQKKQAGRRRTSDITRLAETYSKNVKSLTQDYESSFAQFEKQRAEQFAPYEESLARYQSEIYPAYQQQADQYRQKIQEYESALNAYGQYRDSFFFVNEGNTPTTVVSHRGGYSVGSGTQPSNYMAVIPLAEKDDYQFTRTGTQPVTETVIRYQTVRRGDQYSGYYMETTPYTTQVTTNYETGFLKKRLDTGEFTNLSPEQFQVRSQPATLTEKPPAAPDVPQAPQTPEFDSSQFEARRKQIESEFQREIGERRGARISAVSRSRARPLLQGQPA